MSCRVSWLKSSASYQSLVCIHPLCFTMALVHVPLFTPWHLIEEENYTPTGPNHAWTQFYVVQGTSFIPEISSELIEQENVLNPEEFKSFRIKNDWVRRQ